MLRVPVEMAKARLFCFDFTLLGKGLVAATEYCFSSMLTALLSALLGLYC